jgi:hypothetical protein
MNANHIYFQWSKEFAATTFHTGVSLHSHTLHSREPLDFIDHAARHSSLVRHLIRRCQLRYHACYGTELNLKRAWWTPPLAPLDAFKVEAAQIADLGLKPLVSLTDHDDIDGTMSLQLTEVTRGVPISVEWTVPFRGTFFHLGVHNIDPAKARPTMAEMANITAHPSEHAIREILAALHRNPATLIVFNHPLWDESRVGPEVHRAAAEALLRNCGESIHALELNGLRPWQDNREVVAMAAAWSKPVISGGDRHAVEPNALLNLTRASTFEEFVAEIRGGYSNTLIASHYRDSQAARVFRSVIDAVRTHEDHGMGWKEWPDRVFYQFEDGSIESLSRIWGSRPRFTINAVSLLTSVAGSFPVLQALRTATAQPEPALS